MCRPPWILGWALRHGRDSRCKKTRECAPGKPSFFKNSLSDCLLQRSQKVGSTTTKGVNGWHSCGEAPRKKREIGKWHEDSFPRRTVPALVAVVERRKPPIVITWPPLAKLEDGDGGPFFLILGWPSSLSSPMSVNKQRGRWYVPRCREAEQTVPCCLTDHIYMIVRSSRIRSDDSKTR